MTESADRVDWRDVDLVPAINWNRIDPFDKMIWERLTGNFWLPEKVSLSSDLQSWSTLTESEKHSISMVFAGLTLLDTIQARVGALSLIPDARTPHEADIYIQIAHMECFTGGHELLTPSGWRGVREIAKGDLVAQYDAESETISFAPAVETSAHTPAKTYLIESDNGHIKQHVSPGHRVLVERRVTRDGVTNWVKETHEAQELVERDLSDLRFIASPQDAEPQLEAAQNTFYVSGQTVSVREAPAEEVYGVEVPSTYLVTKNGRAVSITGNCIHAKSYSSIFSTFLSTEEIDDIFRWSGENEFLRKKAAIILSYYRGDDPLKRKIASTLLESFLFYSGFFMPLWWASKGKLVATADIITLIIRDESVHGAYIGAKFGEAYREETPERQEELRNFANDLFWELYKNELRYTEMIYDEMKISEHVKAFLRYNAIKTFQNLGLPEPDFKGENTEVLPQILAALDPGGNANADFFSTNSNYVMGAAQNAEIGEDDWDDMFG